MPAFNALEGGSPETIPVNNQVLSPGIGPLEVSPGNYGSPRPMMIGSLRRDSGALSHGRSPRNSISGGGSHAVYASGSSPLNISVNSPIYSAGSSPLNGAGMANSPLYATGESPMNGITNGPMHVTGNGHMIGSSANSSIYGSANSPLNNYNLPEQASAQVKSFIRVHSHPCYRVKNHSRSDQDIH